MYFMLLLLSLKANRQFFVGNIEAIIYKVTNKVPVDCTQKITGL